MMRIVVATEEEEKLASMLYPGHEIIKTGVGAINVIQALRGLSKDTEIINVGYCGSNIIPIGTTVKIGKCSLYHPNADYEEMPFTLDGDIDCLTSSDFVLQTDIRRPVVFDMELAYILSLGFKNVESVKIVSDNLSLEDYGETIDHGIVIEEVGHEDRNN